MLDSVASSDARPSRDQLVFGANVVINGVIDAEAVKSALNQLKTVRDQDGPLIVEVTTTGGDADAATPSLSAKATSIRPA
jgi:hypothetical protein